MLPPSPAPGGGADDPRSARLAVHRVLAVVRAVLLQLEPVGVVPPVLAGDVVAVLALLAGQGDLRTDVGGCHGCVSSPCRDPAPLEPGARPGSDARTDPVVPGSVGVAVTGFEPVTQRL